MRRTLVLDVVGLARRFVGEHTPNLARLAGAGGIRNLRTVLPAVTCPAQATFLTGLPPSGHGIVANGWYFRELAEVLFWRQANGLVSGEKVWESARRRDPTFTCAQLFWWYNMHSTADITVTPRPMYPADGRKIPDVYTQPPDLREELQERLGTFPLFRFWGPAADLVASRWIADCARHVWVTRKPALTFVYLPHLDYDLQRLGPDDPKVAAALRDVDALCGELIELTRADGARVIVLSEYGITPVSGVVHPNRVLREAGLLRVRRELGRELLDAGSSEAFAVADHQVAHVYVRAPERLGDVKALIERTPGVERVLDEEGQRAAGLHHPRTGELVAVSRADHWFSYYYWLDDARAPDFARTVDIHRKPGYDPVELFLDPGLSAPKLRVAATLLKRALGFRTLMSVISLDASLVRGSHGRLTDRPEDGPCLLSSEPGFMPPQDLQATGVKALILDHLFR